MSARALRTWIKIEPASAPLGGAKVDGARTNKQRLADQISGPRRPAVASPTGEVRAVTAETVERDIQALSTEDRLVVIERLTSQTVQRDRNGHVLDPLPIRLKRVLHRMKKKDHRFSSRGNWSTIDDFDDALRELEEIVIELNDRPVIAKGNSRMVVK